MSSFPQTRGDPNLPIGHGSKGTENEGLLKTRRIGLGEVVLECSGLNS